jgi:beta-mannan synthase
MSTNYHLKVEQEAGSSLCNFFGYNGTHYYFFSAVPSIPNYIFSFSFSICCGEMRMMESSIRVCRNCWSLENTSNRRVWWLEDRTTDEDMDLALRAGVLGWEFVYVGSIKVIFSMICMVQHVNMSGTMPSPN